LSRILDYYRGHGTDAENRTFEEVLAEDNGFWAGSHDHVQWVFPLPEPSNFNADAPLLTQEDIDAFTTGEWHADPEGRGFLHGQLHRAYERFLNFLGLYDCKGVVYDSQSPPAAARRLSTLARFNHNYLRITRCLRCLTLLGHGWCAKAMLKYFEDNGYREKEPKSWAFWEEACKGGPPELEVRPAQPTGS